MLAVASWTVEGFCVTNIRALRLSHGLSLVELALLCDIPARTLAEIEYGIQRLDYESRSRLARIFDLPPEQLWAGSAPPGGLACHAWRARGTGPELFRRQIKDARQPRPALVIEPLKAVLDLGQRAGGNIAQERQIDQRETVAEA